ncbi:hypothetical protein [Phaeobacter gallaeciensis]|nr:hypothetical protein [Phaeobacter gallaeciensis]
MSMMQPIESGRARVRRVLIEPLEIGGMVRARGVSLTDHQAMLVRLQDKLAYLSEHQLRGMAEFAVFAAKGKAGNVWPDEVLLCRWAYRTQPPPPRKSDYVSSLMCSRAGQVAREAGYHVELFLMARRFGPPPTRYDQRILQREATENRDKRALVTKQIETGNAFQSDIDWLGWFQRQEGECLAIMDEQEQGAEA